MLSFPVHDYKDKIKKETNLYELSLSYPSLSYIYTSGLPLTHRYIYASLLEYSPK